MQKIMHWIRGDPNKSLISKNAHQEERWPSSKKWRSTQFGSSKPQQNRPEPKTTTFVEHFDSLANASTSSPTILAEQKMAATTSNGHEKQQRNHRSMRRSERRRESRKDLAATEKEEIKKKSASERCRSEMEAGGRRKSKIGQYASSTTEDILDTRPNFDVTKKSMSANTMIGKKPSFLQRIKQRLSTKSTKEKEDGEHPGAELPPLPPLAREEMRMEKLALARAIKEEVRLDVERRSRKYEKLAIGSPVGSREERAHQLHQKFGEDMEGDSQGRCSSFDYFSVTASPTDQYIQEAIIATPLPHKRIASSGGDEEEIRFATAAEARAYLRRQMAAEGGEQVEEAAFDADDEISKLTVATTTNNSAIADDALCLQRPNSAMYTSSTAVQRNRESIYFTVVQPGFPTAVSAGPFTGATSSPPDRPGCIQPDGNEQQLDPSKHRSKSQQVLAGQLGGKDSPLGGSQGSEPNSTKMGRKLRFIIPQVSICSVDGEQQQQQNTSEATSRTTTKTAGDENNNNNLEGNVCGSLVEDLNNNNNSTSTMTASSSQQSIQTTLLPCMLGVGPEAEEELKRVLSQMDKKELTLAQRRQSNMDFVHQASGRRTSTTLIPLTSAQIHLIRSLWRQVYLSKGPTVIGSQISHRLFFKEPETRELFRRNPLPQKYVNHDSFSKAHCKQISEMIDQVVENLDDLENVNAVLENIGRIHARSQLSSKLWNSVAETFIDCTLEWGDRRARSETVRKAWALIIAFMIERIKHGHLEERRQITAIRSTIASLERFAVGGAGNESAQQSPNQQNQLPMPMSNCPIRRVSAIVNGAIRPVKFSPDQFRTSDNPTASSSPLSLVSPMANRRKPLRVQPSPRSRRSTSDVQRPRGLHGRKGSADLVSGNESLAMDVDDVKPMHTDV